jgi:hypothetical protein
MADSDIIVSLHLDLVIPFIYAKILLMKISQQISIDNRATSTCGSTIDIREYTEQGILKRKVSLYH